MNEVELIVNRISINLRVSCEVKHHGGFKFKLNIEAEHEHEVIAAMKQLTVNIRKSVEATRYTDLISNFDAIGPLALS